MKFSKFILIAIVSVSFAVAKEDSMDVALDKCLSKLKLDQVEKLSEEQESCLNGCLLQLYGLIGENGKLLPNGIDNFRENIPKEYQRPTMLDELTQLKPKLLDSNDACKSGEIAEGMLGDFEIQSE